MPRGDCVGGTKGGAVVERRCRGVTDVARRDWDRGVGSRGRDGASMKAAFRRLMDMLSVCEPRSTLKNLANLWSTRTGPS